jgi:hypothetical protein
MVCKQTKQELVCCCSPCRTRRSVVQILCCTANHMNCLPFGPPLLRQMAVARAILMFPCISKSYVELTEYTPEVVHGQMNLFGAVAYWHIWRCSQSQSTVRYIPVLLVQLTHPAGLESIGCLARLEPRSWNCGLLWLRAGRCLVPIPRSPSPESIDPYKKVSSCHLLLQSGPSCRTPPLLCRQCSSPHRRIHD